MIEFRKRFEKSVIVLGFLSVVLSGCGGKPQREALSSAEPDAQTEALDEGNTLLLASAEPLIQEMPVERAGSFGESDQWVVSRQKISNPSDVPIEILLFGRGSGVATYDIRTELRSRQVKGYFTGQSWMRASFELGWIRVSSDEENPRLRSIRQARAELSSGFAVTVDPRSSKIIEWIIVPSVGYRRCTLPGILNDIGPFYAHPIARAATGDIYGKTGGGYFLGLMDRVRGDVQDFANAVSLNGTLFRRIWVKHPRMNAWAHFFEQEAAIDPSSAPGGYYPLPAGIGDRGNPVSSVEGYSPCPNGYL